jgi:hypothetical protein
MLTFLYQPVYCESEILAAVTLKSDASWGVVWWMRTDGAEQPAACFIRVDLGDGRQQVSLKGCLMCQTTWHHIQQTLFVICMLLVWSASCLTSWH